MSFETSDPVGKHMGHLFLECMKKFPDAICQIDAATGDKETNASVLSRSIQLARCFKSSGLRPGDVLSLGGRNHLDLHIPFYAALLNGLPISGVDPSFKFDEIKSLFKISRPKIAFCQNESYEMYKEVVNALGLDTKIITFGSGENNMEHFVGKYDTNEPIENYIPEEFDLDKIYAFLPSTSGTSGKLKLAAIKHENMIHKMYMYGKMSAVNNSTVINQVTLNLSPINWISGYYNAIGLPIIRRIKLQTSNPDDLEHVIDIINKYKPVSALVGPSLISSILNRKDDVDLTCFRLLSLTGGKIYPDMKTQFQSLLHKDAVLLDIYGMTETLGPCLAPNIREPANSCGRRIPSYDIKFIDPESGKEVTKPNTPGECLVKGVMFSGYYNDPEETARSYSEDGYFKTGDLLYFDENDNFYYVDRLKDIIKFRDNHILPVELEEVIQAHPAVSAVCVCGIPDRLDGQRPVACVVTSGGCTVSAQEIEDLVAEKLSKNKKLTGGVVFLDKLPMTSTGKISRAKLLDIISKLPKE